MSRLEECCENAVCTECILRKTKVLCNYAWEDDNLSFKEILENAKKDIEIVEKRSKERAKDR